MVSVPDELLGDLAPIAWKWLVRADMVVQHHNFPDT